MVPRIAITGMGLVSPLGLDVATYWAGLCEGKSGVSFITEFPTDKLRSDVAAMVPGFDPSRWLDKKEQEIYGRVEQFSVAAAFEAIESARLEGADKTRVGVLMSTGQGAVEISRSRFAAPTSADRAPFRPTSFPGSCSTRSPRWSR